MYNYIFQTLISFKQNGLRIMLRVFSLATVIKLGIYSFYKKAVYKKLGVCWLKNYETSRTAISFQRKLSYIENLRN